MTNYQRRSKMLISITHTRFPSAKPPERFTTLSLIPPPHSSSQTSSNGLVKHDSKQLTRNCHIIVHSPSQSVEKKSLCLGAVRSLNGGTKLGKLISLRGRRSTRSRRRCWICSTPGIPLRRGCCSGRLCCGPRPLCGCRPALAWACRRASPPYCISCSCSGPPRSWRRVWIYSGSAILYLCSGTKKLCEK